MELTRQAAAKAAGSFPSVKSHVKRLNQNGTAVKNGVAGETIKL
jgi:hypothetical protein